MYRKYLKYNLFGLCALAITACGSASSSKDISNSEIDARITVDGEGNNVLIQADLQTIAPKFQGKPIRLSTEDQLTANLDGEVAELTDTLAQEILDDGLIPLLLTSLLFSSDSTFVGGFNNNRDGAEVTVTLNRAGERAYGSVMMPDPVFMNAPSAADTFTAGDSISIVWTAGDPTRDVFLTIRSSCPVENDQGIDNFYYSDSVSDTGIATISVNEIANQTRSQMPTGVNCTAEIRVARNEQGTTRGFGSGIITATQSANVAVNLIP